MPRRLFNLPGTLAILGLLLLCEWLIRSGVSHFE